jgi:hypothetical protein
LQLITISRIKPKNILEVLREREVLENFLFLVSSRKLSGFFGTQRYKMRWEPLIFGWKSSSKKLYSTKYDFQKEFDGDGVVNGENLEIPSISLMNWFYNTNFY